MRWQQNLDLTARQCQQHPVLLVGVMRATEAPVPAEVAGFSGMSLQKS
jgi:hypothetical protein